MDTTIINEHTQTFNNFQCMDSKLCWYIQHAFDAMILRRLYFTHGGEKNRNPRDIHEHLTKCLSLVGSSVEGAAIAHMFDPHEKAVEVDMMYCIAAVNDDFESIIHRIKAKPGFCHIHNNDHFAKALSEQLQNRRKGQLLNNVEYYWHKLVHEKDSEYLSGEKVKAMAQKYFQFRDDLSIQFSDSLKQPTENP